MIRIMRSFIILVAMTLGAYAATPKSYCVVENGIVVNVVLWDGDASKWQPPAGAQIVQSDMASIGWSYNPSTNAFTSPDEPPSSPNP